MSKKEFWLLLFILVAAAFLRLYRIADYMTFLGDEGRDVLVVKKIIVDHKFTLLGPTASVGGFFLGPVYYYLMIPFLWAFRLNPVGPAVMVALFGIATVFLVYKVGKDFFSKEVGLLSASLFSISPVVIAYSRSSWNPNLMPFFSLLIIWLTWRTVSEKKPEYLIGVGFLLGVAIQLHYLTVFLMAVVAVYLFLFFRRLRYVKHYLGLIGGIILGWSPFLLFEVRHGFPNFRTLYKFIFFSEETGFLAGRFFPIIFDVLPRLFSRLVANNQRNLSLGLLFVSLFFLVTFIKKERAKSKRLAGLLSLFWLVIGVGLFGFYQKGIYDYYFGFMFPLPFFLTSLALTKIAQNRRLGFFLAFIIGIYLVALNLKAIPFRYPPNRQLNQAREAARFVLDKAGDKPFNFALITGHNSDHAYRYFFEIWGNPPIIIENPQVDPERKTVTEQLFVICETTCSPEGHPLWEVAGFGRAQISNRWQVSVLEIYELRHYLENSE